MACEKAGIRAGYIRRKTLNTYIYKTKKYIIAQILWDLAGVICLAFSPLLQQCLFDYGQTFCMKKAATLLKETTSSISEIMEELHFTNTTHFYKCFKEHYHMTPNQFRISSKNKH